MGGCGGEVVPPLHEHIHFSDIVQWGILPSGVPISTHSILALNFSNARNPKHHYIGDYVEPEEFIVKNLRICAAIKIAYVIQKHLFNYNC